MRFDNKAPIQQVVSYISNQRPRYIDQVAKLNQSRLALTSSEADELEETRLKAKMTVLNNVVFDLKILENIAAKAEMTYNSALSKANELLADMLLERNNVEKKLNRLIDLEEADDIGLANYTREIEVYKSYKAHLDKYVNLLNGVVTILEGEE